MDLQEAYPILFDFFAGYFPDADLDGLTDTEVVAQYISHNSADIVKQTLDALTSLPNDTDVLKSIASEANRHFESTEDIKDWLTTIKAVFIKN